jgi:GNAT superfamily N-acetyltransferase
VRNAQWRSVGVTERAERLREQTGCDDPGATSTSGLVAYLDGEPAGWCAVEPRTAYPRLRTARNPWAGRDEDKDDAGVWAVTCFVTRVGYRRRGVMRSLAAAAVGFARERGARALEGYPIVREPGLRYDGGELFVGSDTVFAAAGFTEVSRPTARRAVLRIEL